MRRNPPVWLLVVLIVSAVIAVPLLTIWALNTLFALAIPYTWQTWFALTILLGLLSKDSVSRKS